ncbi:MAG: hypothetical protein JWP87_3860 [Labilithrix sp.]|nr:hypothetical protein [Labilithrix sp.]
MIDHMTMAPCPSSSSRLHVVLVPGFAGFDALGQIEYYAGVTPLFRQWQAESPDRSHVVLHYFDNLPTAGIVSRAARLRGYLAKRIERGELEQHDSVALVGHSTGGLDIRRLICDLVARPDERCFPSDQGIAFTVRAGDILRLVKSIVFVSVPQWGTNFADWMRRHRLARQWAVRELGWAVTAARLRRFARLEASLAGAARALTDADLFLALKDAATEIALPPRNDPKRPVRLAEALEAGSELEVWMRCIAEDFGAIDDIAVTTSRGTERSPAHFSPEQRADETRAWSSLGIVTKSYATVGPRPFTFPSGAEAAPLSLVRLGTFLASELSAEARERTDVVYRLVYRACAGGPFRYPPNGAREATLFGTSSMRRVELWDSDGIVNTASMLWPDGEATQVVEADHGDILGHYRLVKAPEASARIFRAYDLLRSAAKTPDDPGFTDAMFRKVWTDVLGFVNEARE